MPGRYGKKSSEKEAVVRYLVEWSWYHQLVDVSPGMGERDRVVAAVFEEYGTPVVGTRVKISKIEEPDYYIVEKNDYTLTSDDLEELRP